jgi:hypothetical protein
MKFDIFNKQKLNLLEQLNRSLVSDNSNLELENIKLRGRVSELELQQADPRRVVEEILKKNIQFVPLDKLTFEQQVNYHVEATKLSTNEVLLNEVSYLIDCWSKWALSNATDFRGVQDMRMSANGLKMLIERFESIPDPRTAHSTEEIYNGV